MWDLWRHLPNIARGKAEVIREASIAVDTDDGHLAADMPLTRPAEEAMAAADVSFSRDHIARFDVFHGGSDLLNDTHEFVSNDQRWMKPVRRPVVPRVDVNVRAAHPCFLDAHHH